MKSLPLNTKLLIGISVLVVASVAIIALLGSYHYSRALQAATITEGEYLSHSLALEATDNILINDMVALQKLIRHHQTIHTSVAYIFIVHDGQILAHTFEGGFPVALIDANQPLSAARGRYQSILADSGDRYLDFAWPILEGKAGTLRLGLAHQVVRQRIVGLWVEMMVGALVVLIAALAAGAVIARRISNPITRLAETADQIDAGNLDVDIVVKGEDEIGRLGQAFSRMMARIREYTRRLEDQTCELDHAYQQTRNSFEILQKIGTQTALQDVCAHLFERFNEMMNCNHFMMVMLTSDRRHTMVFTDGSLSVHPPANAATLLNLLRDSDDILFVPPQALPADIQTGPFTASERVAVFRSATKW